MRHFSALPSSLLALISTVALTHTSALPEDEPSWGVQIDELRPATCSRPSQAGDTLSVDYRGTFLTDGREFDSSYKGGSPFTFKIGTGQVIKGWDMGLLGMCPGEERRLTIPPELGYGDRTTGPIPGGSTLVFDTALRDIIGVKQAEVSTVQGTSLVASPTTSIAQELEDMLSIATAPPTPDGASPSGERPPPPFDDKDDFEEFGSEAGPMKDGEKPKKRCQLLGPFALLVQGALGGFAILTLVWKRYRETPQRPWKIWFFDVSKQVFGSMLTHILNIAMSILSSVQLANQAEQFASQAKDEQGHRPNPCSFYLLNLAIDTTIGIPVLYILLIVIHALFLRTPIARPPQSIKSGSYGDPPKTTWYLKQLLIYFLGLTGMKFSVFFLFSILPWLPWVGDWALRWTQFDERVEIAFAMFIFPLIMNGIQYYVIDNLIMDRKKDKVGYQSVHAEDDRDEEERLVGDEDSFEGHDARFKIDDEEDEPLKDNDALAEGSYSSSGQSTLTGNDVSGKKSK